MYVGIVASVQAGHPLNLTHIRYVTTKQVSEDTNGYPRPVIQPVPLFENL